MKLKGSLVYRDYCFMLDDEDRFKQYDLHGEDKPITYRPCIYFGWLPYGEDGRQLSMAFSQEEIAKIYDVLVSMSFEEEVL